MLVDVTLRDSFPPQLLGDPKGTTRLQQGVYRCSHWNFELEFRGYQDFHLDFPELRSGFGCYGVCDSPEQLISLLPEEVTAGPRQFVVSMVQILKSKTAPEGGWRWHKWGPYIGSQSPTCEYLYDEPDIDEVWTYSIYEVGMPPEECPGDEDED